MRLGDLDRIAQDVRDNNIENYYKQDWTSSQIVTLLENAPTIDAVPVVRCRECTHYKICDEWKNGKRMLCEIHHHSYLDHDGDNHFCSWGQRKIETVLPKSDAKDESLEADHEVS